MKKQRWMVFSHICCRDYMTGSEKNLLLFIKELQRRHEPVLIIPQPGMLQEEACKLGVRTAVFPYPMLVRLWRPGAALRAELGELDRTHAPLLLDLLHSWEPDFVAVNAAINPLPALAASRLGLPVVWMLTEIVEQGSYAQESVHAIGQLADGLIGISDAVLAPWRKTDYAANIVKLSPPCPIAPLPGETAAHLRSIKREELGISSSAPLIGFVSADLVPHKGLEHFIRMALEMCLSAPETRYLICGHPTDADYAERCRSMIERSSFAHRFRFCGFEKRIEAIYAAIDVLVVPSLIPEGFGMTALEGLFCGKPVVAYRTGGLEELLTESGYAQFLAEPGNVDDLAKKTAMAVSRHMDGTWNGRAAEQRIMALYGVHAYRSKLDRWIGPFAERAKTNRREAARLRNKIPDGVVAKGSSSMIFLIENGSKRPFQNPESFHFYRYKETDIADVEDFLLALIPTGHPIDRSGHFIPNAPGQLLVQGEGESLHLWTGGKLHPVCSLDLLFNKMNFRPDDIVSIPETIIAALPKGDALTDDYLFTFGPIHSRLYRSPAGELYYADRGRLRHVPLWTMAAYFRWKPEQAAVLSAEAFGRLPKGPPILA